MDNYNYPEGADNEKAPWNQAHESGILIRAFDQVGLTFEEFLNVIERPLWINPKDDMTYRDSVYEMLFSVLQEEVGMDVELENYSPDFEAKVVYITYKVN